MEKRNFLLESNNGRLGNQLYSILMTATYILKNNSDKYKLPFYVKDFDHILQNFLNSVDKGCLLYQSIDINNFDEIYKQKQKSNSLKTIYNFDQVDTSEEFSINFFPAYLQRSDLIDERFCQEILKPDKKIIEKIKSRIENINEYICLHVRRTDYLLDHNRSIYITLTRDWIEKTILKYFPKDTIICISDDIDWCKENLNFSGINIKFLDNSDLYQDFWIQTLTKGNICSCSSFSLIGAMLNPNLNAVIPVPYYKTVEMEAREGKPAVPGWMRREPIKLGDVD